MAVFVDMLVVLFVLLLVTALWALPTLLVLALGRAALLFLRGPGDPPTVPGARLR